MKNDDVQLIQRVLDDDDTAFSMLVKSEEWLSAKRLSAIG